MENDRLKRIFRKTDGYCHICHRRLIFANHGIIGARGAWHIDHSKAKANRGSDHINNLFPACISCNIEKGVLNTKTIRLRYGKSRAPLSKRKKESIKSSNTAGGVIVGGSLGLALGGPVGGIIGGLVGGIIGNDNSLKK